MLIAAGDFSLRYFYKNRVLADTLDFIPAYPDFSASPDAEKTSRAVYQQGNYFPVVDIKFKIVCVAEARAVAEVDDLLLAQV